MSLNTVPTNYHEFEYSKLSVFKLKFMTNGRIHAERWALCHDLFGVCASAAHGAACVRFRCGPPRDAEGVVLQLVDHAYLLPLIVAGRGWWLSGFWTARRFVFSCSRVGAHV